MNNEIYDDNAIFLSMVEAIEITNKDEENIAEVTRNLEQLKKKKERDIKKVHQYAANYFTKEKILSV